MDRSIRRECLDAPVVMSLIEALNAELLSRYPEPGATHFGLEEADVAPANGAFIVAREGDRPIGCGAVRRIDGETAEIKRMFVLPKERGNGHARAILAALELKAAAIGAKRIVLETGVRQPEAIRLYRRSGYCDIPPYGEYVGSPLSVCMGKNSTAESTTSAERVVAGFATAI